MLRRTLLLAFAAILVALAMASEAGAWGAYHASFSHYGPATGFTHGSTTGFASPYGGASHSSGYHYGAYGSGGFSAGAYRRW